ncbi:MAG: 30S ribosomal protein S8 [Candidatus Sungbacteria bacterium RIFCSPHIGHO2_01_FULL_50_25]|uniref:Small ribosomal subunit protein uS8 n=1 Tax=Candidatus Sungbacteria bacterium RIFCSPHIGHO2_01_FULL_50_25 TaxID=1802265 RepID=A0A1G2K7W3_9BACT|nr:MAG: 30S ribosomal protein S8 [Candidatus Sungbacteria bacterium RIFCSPHIGHO2_01_FULL_50_25]
MDPISDMFIRIKNANTAKRETVLIPYSKFKLDIVKALSGAGCIGAVEVKGKRVRKTIEVALRYEDGDPKIKGVKMLSKPSRRLYAPYKDVKPSPRGGVVLLTTPKGILTDRMAKNEKVGGQLIAEVW